MTKNSHFPNLAALVLSGGESRRMGGKDKALLEIAEKPMISYVLNSLSQCIDDITISSNKRDDSYQTFGYPIVHDILTGQLGPLAGIHAGLTYAKTQRLLIVPCDSPFLNIELCSLLLEAMDAQQAHIAVAHDGDYLQATFAIIDVQLADSLAKYLNRGGRRLVTWYQEENYVPVDLSAYKESFTNINNHLDIEAANKRLQACI